jgi:hypothetical protein
MTSIRLAWALPYGSKLKAMRLPSGDQVGDVSNPASLVSGIGSRPSRNTMWMSASQTYRTNRAFTSDGPGRISRP